LFGNQQFKIDLFLSLKEIFEQHFYARKRF